MNIEEVAARLTGSEYPLRVPSELNLQAKSGGIVIVYGGSDDLMEFEGAISDELGAYEGTTVLVSPDGILEDFQTLVEAGDKERLRNYFKNEGKGREIEALWAVDGYSWMYKTDIPHATFEIVEDGDTYCRGIVFRLSDCAS